MLIDLSHEDKPHERELDPDTALFAAHVMKPCKVDMRKKSHRDKLHLALRSSNYIAEEKIDGHHYLAVDGHLISTHISVVTGLPVDKTENLIHISKAIQDLGLTELVLDGEIHLPIDGCKSYDVQTVTGSDPAVARKWQEKTGLWAHFRVFDILRDLEGNWLHGLPWHERRKLLEEIQPELESTGFIFVNPVVSSGKVEFLEGLLKEGKEGIVLKDINGRYSSGKRPMWNWIKVKQEKFDDVVIMGYEPAERLYSGENYEEWPFWEEGEPVSKYHALGWIGSIIVGKYDQAGKLVRMGTVSGMNEYYREKFSMEGDKYIGRVIKIKLMEETKGGKFRHANFKELHADKNAKECLLGRD